MAAVMSSAHAIDPIPPSPELSPKMAGGGSSSFLAQLAGRICFIVFSLLALLRGFVNPFDSIFWRGHIISVLYQQGKQQQAGFGLWLRLGSMTLWCSLQQANELENGVSDGSKESSKVTLDSLVRCDRLRKKFKDVGFEPGPGLAYLSDACLDWLETESERDYLSDLFSPSDFMSQRPTFKKLLTLPQESLAKLEPAVLEELLKKDVKDLEKCCSTLGITLAQLVQCNDANLKIFLSKSKEIKEWIDKLRGTAGFPAKWQEELPIPLIGLFGSKSYRFYSNHLSLFKQLTSSFQELKKLPEATLEKVIEEASGYSHERLEGLLSFPGFSWELLGRIDLERVSCLLSLNDSCMKELKKLPRASFGHLVELAKSQSLQQIYYIYSDKKWVIGEFFKTPIETLSALSAEEIKALLDGSQEVHDLCKNHSLAAFLQLDEPKRRLLLENRYDFSQLITQYNLSFEQFKLWSFPLLSFLTEKRWKIVSYCGFTNQTRFDALIRRLLPFASDGEKLAAEFEKMLAEEEARSRPRTSEGWNWWEMPGEKEAPRGTGARPTQPPPTGKKAGEESRSRPRTSESWNWWERPGEKEAPRGTGARPTQPPPTGKKPDDPAPHTNYGPLKKAIADLKEWRKKEGRALKPWEPKEDEAKKKYQTVKQAAEGGGPARKFFGFKETDPPRPDITSKLMNSYRLVIHPDKVVIHPTDPEQTRLRKQEADQLFHCLSEAKDALSEENPYSY